MIPITSIKYLFLVFFLNQMLNICALKEQEYTEEVSIDTEYLVGNLNMTWSIADYSRIFDTVHTTFTHQYTSTNWELILEDKKRIYLKRIDNGEPVFADIHYTLVTQNRNIEGEKKFTFHHLGNLIIYLLNLDIKKLPHLEHVVRSDPENLYDYNANNEKKITKVPIAFKNDVFIFKIKMKIFGPEVSKTNATMT